MGARGLEGGLRATDGWVDAIRAAGRRAGAAAWRSVPTPPRRPRRSVRRENAEYQHGTASPCAGNAIMPSGRVCRTPSRGPHRIAASNNLDSSPGIASNLQVRRPSLPAGFELDMGRGGGRPGARRPRSGAARLPTDRWNARHAVAQAQAGSRHPPQFNLLHARCCPLGRLAGCWRAPGADTPSPLATLAAEARARPSGAAAAPRRYRPPLLPPST